MLLIFDRNHTDKNPLPVAQIFVNLQMLEDGTMDSFSQFNFITDDNYSNFETIRQFFVDGMNPSQIATYEIQNDDDFETTLVHFNNGFISNIGINALSPSPRITVDYKRN